MARNVITKNYPFSSISGRLSFAQGWYFISVPSSLLGLFPGGPPHSPCPCWLAVFSLRTQSPPPKPTFCPHSSFHCPVVEVKGMWDALPGCSSCGCSEGSSLSSCGSPWTELIYFHAAVATFVYLCARGTQGVMGKVTRNL